MINKFTTSKIYKALFFSALATTSAFAAPLGSETPEAVLESPLDNLSANASVQIFSVPEPSRIVLIGIGICLLSVTYRSAWVSMRRASEK